MTPDSFSVAGWTAWLWLLSASLAAIGVYDLLYVFSAVWRRSRAARRRAAESQAAIETRLSMQTRMKTATDRREPPYPMKHPNELDARALKKRLEDRDVIIGVLRERCQLLETLVPLVRELLGERSFTTSEEPLFPRMKKVLADIDAPPKGAPSA